MVEWRRGTAATRLLGGVTLLVLSGLGMSVAVLTGLQSMARSSDLGADAVTVAVVSGLAGLVGLGLTLVGLWGVTSSIELVAQSVQDAADAAERDEAARREALARAGRDALLEFRSRAAGATHDASVATE